MYECIGTPTGLYSIDATTNPTTFTLIGSVSAVNYNAIAYNPMDNFIYANQTSNPTNHLLKMGTDGVVHDLGHITGLAAGAVYFAGAFDNSGNYYLTTGSPGSSIYKVNVSTLAATAIVPSIALSTADMAFNPSDGLFYAVDNQTKFFVSIDPATGTVTNIGASGNPSGFGAMWSGPGKIYGMLNGGALYQIDIATGVRYLLAASSFSGSFGNIDGGSCFTTAKIFLSDLGITQIIDNPSPCVNSTVTFTITATNNGPINNQFVAVNDVLPAGYTFVSATPSVGTWSAPTWSIGNLDNLASATLQIVATVNASGSYTNTATISGNQTDNVSANNAAAVAPTVACTLPITLTSFTATPTANCSALLQWQTANELNSKAYQIEQSTDGVNFVQAASIVSKNDAAGASYKYAAQNLAVGNNYFRLKAVDADGKFTYSKIVFVKSTCTTSASITLLPNPTTDVVNITGLVGNNTITIYDATGRRMLTQQSFQPNALVSIGKFAKGVYTIRIVDAQGVVTNAKVVKE